MYYFKTGKKPSSFVTKACALVLCAVLLLLGVVGLILPIIPGVLFLFLAFYVLTKVSKRVAAIAHDQAWFSHHARKLDAAGGLPMGSRFKLTLWVIAGATVGGIQALASKVTGLFRQ
ncbi:MAG: DUF454 family protein [Pseudohongiellaceae bacterium]|nr:DUF454 family protein [Pseudohongiellaceae bacterium]